MLYYMGLADVQLLMLSLAMVMLIAGMLSIYIPRHTIISSLVMLLIFTLGYHTMIASSAVTGKPSFDATRMEGVLGGYLGFRHGDKVYIAVLINTSTGPELIAIPYSQSANDSLQQGMEKYIVEGIPQLVRGKQEQQQQDSELESDEQGQGGGDGQDDGAVEVYDFAQDHLPTKQQ